VPPGLVLSNGFALFVQLLATPKTKSVMPESGKNSSAVLLVSFDELTNFSNHESGLGISPIYPPNIICPGLVQIHANNFYLVVVVQQGRCDIESENRKAEITQGSFLFVPRNMVHKMTTISGTKGYFLAFTEAFLNQELNLDYLNFSLLNYNNRIFQQRLDKVEFAQLDELVRFLLQEYNLLHYPLKPMALKYRLGLVLIFLQKCIQNEEPASEINIMNGYFTFRAFEKLVETHFIKEKSVDFYATQLAISTKKLNDLVKEHAKTTILDFVNERAIIEAKRLLLFTDMPIKGIAYELGFSSDSYFNRFFKKYVLASALIFREKGRQKK